MADDANCHNVVGYYGRSKFIHQIVVLRFFDSKDLVGFDILEELNFT